ncbi:MAG: phosphoribosylanthranilate isomerase [Pikeienuella sp.]
MSQTQPAPDAVRVKICGIADAPGARAAVEAGAAYLGFVLFPPSPRNIAPENLSKIAAELPPGVVKVALVVDPDEALIAQLETLPVDMVQLHGRETPERVAQVKRRLGLPVMKAIGIREPADLAAIGQYAGAADQLLVDAKPPKGATRPGGNAVAFDWTLLQGVKWPVPWLLAGGLTPQTVGRAIGVTGARQVDVSSGVERAPGVKDPTQIAAFIAAAQGRIGAL